MGSKKKKGKASKQGSRSEAARQTKPDMSKYAGATSNKSKRNYADLKLARPGRLKEYASGDGRAESAAPTVTEKPAPPPATPKKRSSAAAAKRTAGKQKNSGQSPGQPAKKSAQKLPPKKSGKAAKKAASWVEEFSRAASKGFTNRPPRNKTAPKKSPPKKSPESRRSSAPAGSAGTEYIPDEYSKALSGSDFYSSVYKIYDIKHPENAEKKKASSGARPVSNPEQYHRRGKKKGDMPPIKGNSQKAPKSVAAIAVKNRGTAAKKKNAQVVKGGKARGTVSPKVAHRSVHRRNRRRARFFNAMMVMIVVVFLAAVYVNVFFNVKNIEVKGESPYNAASITAMCGFEKGDNILFIDTQQGERQIVESLPYIESCTIRRRLPATVVVNVTNANVLGVSEAGNHLWSVVSTSGKVLETVTDLQIVSASDVVSSLVYAPQYTSLDDVARSKALPVLEGLDLRGNMSDGHVEGTAAKYVDGFVNIIEEGKALDMTFNRIRHGERGFEAEYEDRINIVFGEVSNRKIIHQRIELAHYVICESGDVTEHDQGEITFSRNETYFNPSYDISPDATENELDKRREKTDSERMMGLAEKLLEQGGKYLPDDAEPDSRDGQNVSSAPENGGADAPESSESPESTET